MARFFHYILLSLLVACGGGGGVESNGSNGVSVTLNWDPPTHFENNIPINVSISYLIYIGNTPGTYTSTYDVGTNTTYAINGLTLGEDYYFAATAYVTGDLTRESIFSNELHFLGAIMNVSRQESKNKLIPIDQIK